MRRLILLAMLVIACAPPQDDVAWEVRHRANEWSFTCHELRMGPQRRCDEWAEERLRRGQFDE